MRVVRSSTRSARAQELLTEPLYLEANHERLYATAAERTLPVSPSIAWAILSDTNRWDRIVGMPRSTYDYEEIALGLRARVGRATYRGFLLRWLEVGEWIEGAMMWGERRFLHGRIPRAGFRIEVLGDDGRATRIRATAYAAADDVAGQPIALYWQAQFRTSMRTYFDALERLLSSRALPQRDLEDSPPPSLSARRILLDARPAVTISTPVTPPRDEPLRTAKRSLSELGADSALARRILDHVTHRPDEEVVFMRPFDLATSWGVDRRALLRTFLLSCRAGLVNLVWQLVCPRCRVGAAQRATLAEVAKRVHCDECGIEFDVDFAHNVEAIFQVNPAIRPASSSVYCAGSPWFRPHVIACLLVRPRGTSELGGRLPSGSLAVRTRGSVHVDVRREDPTEARLTIRIAEDGTLHARSVSGPAGIIVENASNAPHTVIVERASWDADIVRGTLLLTFPEFLDLFAVDAPASGDQVSVGALTVLFSDLTGSTALYERLGDARAFGIVQEHFRSTANVIATHEGAVLKTMGDAVMATFPSPSHALAAATEMIRKTDEEAMRHGIADLAVKIGIHEGPCLMVRANGRMDVFGTTVNLTARLQARARAGEIVVLASTWERLESNASLPDEAPRIARFDAKLRGLSVERSLVAIDPTGRGASRHGSIGPAARGLV